MASLSSPVTFLGRFGSASPDGGDHFAPHGYFDGTEIGVYALHKARPLRETPKPEDTSLTSRFGRRVRSLRQERNLTQIEMAKKFGIDRSYISDLERGHKSSSLPMIEVIALGMGISLAALFEGL